MAAKLLENGGIEAREVIDVYESMLASFSDYLAYLYDFNDADDKTTY